MTRSGRHGGFAGGFGYVGGRRQVALIRPTADPILAQLCAALDATYGGSIERVVLFGSPARCDADADSDYDVAAFLRAAADQ
jgi:hypothetical protein